MFICGLDLGSRTCHAVLATREEEIADRIAVPVAADLSATARRAMEEFGVRQDEVQYVAATGFGRYQVSFRDIAISDVTCHAYGARFLVPGAAAAIDVGAQNSRAMKFREDGRVMRFKMNDKCAAGAGKFLERVARAMDLPLEEVGPASLRAQAPVAISSICAVLAESEIINHVTEGRAVEDILMGAHLSIAERVIALLRQVSPDGPVALTGGISRNPGMVAALERKFGAAFHVPRDAEFAGAIGAALLALRRLRRMESHEQALQARN